MVGFGIAPSVRANQGVVMAQMNLECVRVKENEAFKVTVTEKVKDGGRIRGIRQSLSKLEEIIGRKSMGGCFVMEEGLPAMVEGHCVIYY
jgi:hypothetical protein